MMHTISGALRLLSPSSAPAVTIETREQEERPEEPQEAGGAVCPHCEGAKDRVPPLPGASRRRSSGYSHELREIREAREASPRNKAASCSEEMRAKSCDTGLHSLDCAPHDMGFVGVTNSEDASQE